jgi:catechol 2,3-dioxygenase-like lactoylglutathione lyase family enzyme
MRLQWKKPAGAVAQMDDRQAIFDRDIQRAHDFFNRQRIPGASLDARVVGMKDDFAAADHANTADLASTGHFAVVGLIRRERRQLQKRSAGVEQQLNAIADEHLLLPREAIEVAGGTLVARAALAFAQLRGQSLVVFSVEPEDLGVHV